MKKPLKLAGALFLGGVFCVGDGTYDVFIQAGASAKPTQVSIAELDREVPSNRNLEVTGARPLMNEAVIYYETRSYGKVPGSEVYFVPLQDAQLASYSSLTPSIVLRITENQMTSIQNGHPLSSGALQGMRMTHFELEKKAKEVLAQKFGESAVKKMLIIEYQKRPVGFKGGLGEIIGGFVFLALALVVSSDWANRPLRRKRARSKEAPPIIRMARGDSFKIE